MRDYLTLKFGIYLLRWLFSAIVMFVPLWLLLEFDCCIDNQYSKYIHLVLVQIVGAFIFFKIDKFIFSIKE